MPDDPRAGFVDTGIGGFAGEIGPILVRIDNDSALCGFEVARRHCNPSGVCHGGWMSTFADVLAVRQASLTTGVRALGTRTISLTCNYMDSCRQGDWVHGTAAVTGQTDTMVFVRGSAHVEDRIILSFSAILRMFRPPMG